LENRIGIERKLFSTCYVLAWGNRAFYDWLTTIGLMPAKSLKLGALAVPQEFFPDFLRGAIDGDGSITMYQDRWNASKNPKYVYERLFVRIYSASLPFLQWVQAESVQSLGVAGAIVRGQRKPGASQMWELRFAKKESLQVLPRVYYAPGLPSLERKRNDAKRALLMIGAPD
jgi:hypothetical protein